MTQWPQSRRDCSTVLALSASSTATSYLSSTPSVCLISTPCCYINHWYYDTDTSDSIQFALNIIHNCRRWSFVGNHLVGLVQEPEAVRKLWVPFKNNKNLKEECHLSLRNITSLTKERIRPLHLEGNMCSQPPEQNLSRTIPGVTPVTVSAITSISILFINDHLRNGDSRTSHHQLSSTSSHRMSLSISSSRHHKSFKELRRDDICQQSQNIVFHNHWISESHPQSNSLAHTRPFIV